MGSAAWKRPVLAFMLASGLGTVSVPAMAAGDGAAEYRARCASCHGESGAGDGPAAASLRSRPSDLRMLAKSNDGVFPVRILQTIIDGRKTIRAHGNFEMPVWGRALSQGGGDGEAAKRIAAIIDYLQSIQLK